MVEETQDDGGRSHLRVDDNRAPAISFHDKLLQEIDRHEELNKKWKEFEKLEWSTEMVQIGVKENWPLISIAPPARENLRRPWLDCLIVKLLERNIGYRI